MRVRVTIIVAETGRSHDYCVYRGTSTTTSGIFPFVRRKKNNTTIFFGSRWESFAACNLQINAPRRAGPGNAQFVCFPRLCADMQAIEKGSARFVWRIRANDVCTSIGGHATETWKKSVGNVAGGISALRNVAGSDFKRVGEGCVCRLFHLDPFIWKFPWAM